MNLTPKRTSPVIFNTKSSENPDSETNKEMEAFLIEERKNKVSNEIRQRKREKRLVISLLLDDEVEDTSPDCSLTPAKIQLR